MQFFRTRYAIIHCFRIYYKVGVRNPSPTRDWAEVVGMRERREGAVAGAGRGEGGARARAGSREEAGNNMFLLNFSKSLRASPAVPQ